MKILHVITSLQTGGAEKLMVDILPRLCEKGNQVNLCVFNGKHTPFYEQLEKLGIQIIPLSVKGSVYSPMHIIKLIKIIRQGRYDIVHTHNTACQFYGAISSIFCNVPLVTTEHSTENRRRGKKFLSYMDRWMYCHYKYVIGISQSATSNVSCFINTKHTTLITIRNGIDVYCYQNAQPISRSSVGSNDDKRVITMVSGFRYQKDHDTVIRSAKLLSDDYEIWFVGDGERRTNIENLIREQDVGSKVRLLGVRLDVPQILKSSDIIVQSSYIEGFGLAAVEGMAAGKPVIASNVDGLAQVVEGAGILFEPGNDRDLAHKIEQLASNSDYYQQTADRCWKRAQMFDIQKMVDGYLEVYKSL